MCRLSIQSLVSLLLLLNSLVVVCADSSTGTLSVETTAVIVVGCLALVFLCVTCCIFSKPHSYSTQIGVHSCLDCFSDCLRVVV